MKMRPDKSLALLPSKAVVATASVEPLNTPRWYSTNVVPELAVKLHADVAVGDQLVGQGALGELIPAIVLPAFQAHRLLELADPKPELRQIMDVGVRVLESKCPLAEIRHEAKVIKPRHRTFRKGTGTSDQERCRRTR